MSKEKYQITEKATWLTLVIIKHDLEDYFYKLNDSSSDIFGSINELRLVRDSFITLKNLADCIGRVMPILRSNSSAELRENTKRIHKRVDFIDHVRNRSAGHFDTKVTERAVQWIPEIFHEKDCAAIDVYLCHKALLESSINSFLGPSGSQKLFDHEIDILYPPDREVFFKFLIELIGDSIEWVKEVISHLDNLIAKYDSTLVPEMSVVAGQTNFNLAEESSFDYCPEKLLQVLEDAKAEFIKQGRPELVGVLDQLARKVI
ncbi:hypothetical protein [Pseudomonas asiatica]|uniref:Uncharacterized protein n=1 Tax=Pseudomonas asiatica TaxID=2219225 RepID=A0ABU5KWL9_9PSED|nr:hypothetical protein [Pseudomonas asiatica]MDZ5738053.1 hypothetical protein [Pseudomonas asiatica]MDZ5744649.1 hypothetical protein [Pseudomonas asiatica]MDZ5748809.1 hypothetical protein [Pseudomonas asiatica]MDZ5753141.1 hypothetical protein [Pseudomonas asiatica]